MVVQRTFEKDEIFAILYLSNQQMNCCNYPTIVCLLLAKDGFANVGWLSEEELKLNE
jgi:hypothetical protein